MEPLNNGQPSSLYWVFIEDPDQITNTINPLNSDTHMHAYTHTHTYTHTQTIIITLPYSNGNGHVSSYNNFGRYLRIFWYNDCIAVMYLQVMFYEMATYCITGCSARGKFSQMYMVSPYLSRVWNNLKLVGHSLKARSLQ